MRQFVDNIRFRGFILAGLIFTVFVFIVIMIISTSLNTYPVLRFEKNTIDLGEISEASSPEIIINFQNVGHGELIIEQLSGSCPCQELRVTKTRLKSGEQGQLLAKIIPSTRSGSVTDNIRVYSNDPRNPITFLELKRFVTKVVQVIPETLLLDMSTGIETRQVTILGPTNDEKFTLISADVNDLPIETDFRYLGLTTDSRKKWQVNIQLDETKISSAKDSTVMINIKSSSSLKPLIPIQIRIVNRLPITTIPSSLSWFLNGKEDQAENKIISLFYERDTTSKDKNNEIYISFENPEYLHVELLDKEVTGDNYTKWKFEISLSSDPIINTYERGVIHFIVNEKITDQENNEEKVWLDFPVSIINISGNAEVE